MQGLLKQCVGADVSKLTFSTCICKSNTRQEFRFSKSEIFENTKKGFNQFVDWVKKFTDKKVETVYLMEAQQLENKVAPEFTGATLDSEN